MGSDIALQHAPSLRRAPLWFGPALVAVVCWVGGSHQCGPLAALPTVDRLPFAWFVIEQGLAVAVTAAAIGAATALLGGRVPPVRVVLAAVCEARYALALAAALSSRAVADSFLPAQPIQLADHGLRLALGAGHWAWLVVLAAAVAGLQFRAALRYLGPLRLVLADNWRLAAGFAVLVLGGELAGWVLCQSLRTFLFWPP